MDNEINVLIIEDNSSHFELIERSFENASKNYNLMQTSYIKNIKQIYESFKPDIVITDWRLPDGEGIDVFQIFPEIKDLVPVVIMTGFGNEEYAVKALKAGALDYIVKSDDSFMDTPHIVERTIREWQSTIQLRVKENALSISEQKFRSFIEFIPFGFFEIDQEFNLTYYNKIALNLLNLSDREITDFKFIDMFCDMSQKLIKEKIRQALDLGKSNAFRCNIKRKGFINLPVELQFSLLQDDPTIPTFIVIMADITEKVRFEQNQIKENQLSSIGLLAGGIAHDFNNILAAIMGNISLAKLTVDKPADTYPLLDEAEKGCRRAKTLTQQLLTFSKGGAPIKEVTNIVNVIKDSANFVVRGSNVFINYIIDPSISNILVDKGQLSQVIQNIVINSIQSMNNGGQIVIKMKHFDNRNMTHPDLLRTDYVLISIQDQGSGIRKEDLNMIFNPYFTTKIKGNGLGLTICYSIIKQHDGLIEVSSEIDKGSTFKIYLPALIKKIQLSENDNEKSSIPLKNKSIIVMDDDPMIRDIISKILKRFNYKVDIALHGNDMINKYQDSITRKEKYDLAIMDLTIQGGLGGKETIVQLKEIDPNINAIVISGFSNDPILNQYTDFGFSARLSKPFTLNELMNVVNKVLSSC